MENCEPGEAQIQNFVAPCRELSPWASFGWLREGWQDIQRAPRQSLRHGVALTLLAGLMGLLAYYFGSLGLLLAGLFGMVFLAPMLAIGLFSISAALERDQKPTMLRTLRAEKRHLGTQMVSALALLVVCLLWARIASMVHIFVPLEVNPDWVDLIGYWSAQVLVSALFITIIFSVCVFSIPMILHRDVDAVTAVVSSIHAVNHNKRAMLVWALLIVVAVIIGLATFLIGLVIMLPLIAHASWHGYLETIDASQFSRHAEGVTSTARS